MHRPLRRPRSLASRSLRATCALLALLVWKVVVGGAGTTLVADVRALSSEEEVMAALRRFKRRETLRIAYGDIVKGHSVAKVTRQISYVADAIVEAAVDFATRQVTEKHFKRNGRTFTPPHFVVLALGLVSWQPAPAPEPLAAALPMAAPGVQGLGGLSFAQAAAGPTLAGLGASRDTGLSREAPPEFVDWGLVLPEPGGPSSSRWAPERSPDTRLSRAGRSSTMRGKSACRASSFPLPARRASAAAAP